MLTELKTPPGGKLWCLNIKNLIAKKIDLGVPKVNIPPQIRFYKISDLWLFVKQWLLLLYKVYVCVCVCGDVIKKY